MVVERCVVEMVLERGETRHDVVVNGLKEIALCGKVCSALFFVRTHCRRPDAVLTCTNGILFWQGVTEDISLAYSRFQHDGNIDNLTGAAIMPTA
jgi:hypothetical protein